MSADWFYKDGNTKTGPLNNQQLRARVASGQLKPEHLVRRGDSGPWVPAGRIKGLFASGIAGEPLSHAAVPPTVAKPLPKAVKSSPPPSTTAGPLPEAVEPPPAPAEIPPEFTVGQGHKHHVQLDVDKFNIEIAPVMVSRRKMKTGLQSLKKDERKRVTIILMGVICGGSGFGLLVLIIALATGKFSSPVPEVPKDPPAAASAQSPAAETEKKPPGAIPVPAAWPTRWTQVPLDSKVGDVVVTVLKPLRGAPPPAIKAAGSDAEVLIIRVNLQLNDGIKKKIPLTSWVDEKLKKSVFLKDNDKEGKGNTFELLGQVPKAGDDTSAVGRDRIQVRLIFEKPAPIPKTMYLVLPGAAFGAGGTTIAYRFGEDDVGVEKPAPSSPDEKAPGGKGDVEQE